MMSAMRLAVVAVQEVEGRLAAVDDDRLMAEALDRGREQAALDGIVVDDEDGCRHCF